MKKEIMHYIFSANNNKYIYLPETGLILLYDQKIFNYIKSSKNGNPDFNNLISRESTYLDHNPNNTKYIKNLTIFLTRKCNLKCKYCYVINDSSIPNASMKYDLFIRAIEYFLYNFKHDNTLNISFFGGEPLIKFNEMKRFVEHLKKIQTEHNIYFTFSITTNGTILNEKIRDFLLENDFKITISVDENEYLHNKNRPLINGENNYNKVIENITELLKYIDIEARITVQNYSSDLVIAHEKLFQIGVKRINFEYLYSRDNIYTDDDLVSLSKNLNSLAKYYLKKINMKKFIIIKKYYDLLQRIHLGYKKNYFCEAGFSNYALDVDGNIYVCHRFVNDGNKGWLGSIESGIENKRIENFQAKSLVDNLDNNNCSRCWAKYLCGGECYYSASNHIVNNSNSINAQCYFHKELIKNSLNIYVSTKDDLKPFFENVK